MTDIFDERRKGLEADYFRRKDKETLTRLREAMREEARERGEDKSTMKCPRCTGNLHEETHDAVSIDRCDTCGGVWLDAGELEQLSPQEKSAGGWSKILWPGRTDDR